MYRNRDQESLQKRVFKAPPRQGQSILTSYISAHPLTQTFSTRRAATKKSSNSSSKPTVSYPTHKNGGDTTWAKTMTKDPVSTSPTSSPHGVDSRLVGDRLGLAGLVGAGIRTVIRRDSISNWIILTGVLLASGLFRFCVRYHSFICFILLVVLISSYMC